MPRKKELIETVQDYPPYREKRYYPLRVLAVKNAGKPRSLEVTLEHLDPENTGRRCTVCLPLPILPSGSSAEFVKACGQAATVHQSVDLGLCIGKTIRAHFAPAANGNWQATAFTPMPEEPTT